MHELSWIGVSCAALATLSCVRNIDDFAKSCRIPREVDSLEGLELQGWVGELYFLHWNLVFRDRRFQGVYSSYTWRVYRVLSKGVDNTNSVLSLLVSKVNNSYPLGLFLKGKKYGEAIYVSGNLKKKGLKTMIFWQ